MLINGSILLNLNDIKKSLSYFPLQYKSNIFKFTHPLGSVMQTKGWFNIYIGNKRITTLYPQYFKYEVDCPANYNYIIDGQKKNLIETSEIFVNDDFVVMNEKFTRVNVIGFKSKKLKSESGIKIAFASMSKKFSIDKNKKIFRVEFYKNKKFCSMQLVHFK